MSLKIREAPEGTSGYPCFSKDELGGDLDLTGVAGA